MAQIQVTEVQRSVLNNIWDWCVQTQAPDVVLETFNEHIFANLQVKEDEEDARP